MATTTAVTLAGPSLSSLRSASFPPSSVELSSTARSARIPAFHGLRDRRPAPRLPTLPILSSRTSSSTICMSYDAGVGLLGNKVGMMTYFTEEGQAVPVTVIGFREGNIVTQVKTDLTDGYNAVQIGYRRVRERKINKPEMGHLKKAGVIPLRHLQEFRLMSVEDFEPGQRLNLEEIFKEGDLVDVSGKSIGKGFQGGIKRHNFKRGSMTHGSKSHRELGSIGAGTTPGRVYPGKKMPGRLGGTQTKIRKLKVVKVDSELRTLLVKGAIPGKPGNLVRIAPAKIVGKNIPKSSCIQIFFW